jgi:membrane associated rhomboid family serine protease
MKGQFLPYKDENPTEHWPVVTASLLLINTAVFLWSLFDFEAIVTTWGFIPADFVPVTLLTSIFLHGSVVHIFGNMLFLYIYGDNVEDKFGKPMFIAFYLSAGVFAGFVHFLSDPSSAIPTIGASGAISGVLGAYLAMFPRVKVRTIGPFYMMYRIRASVLIGLWFVLQLILGAFSLAGYGTGIAFFAHIGGFAFGYVAGRIYCSGKPKTQPKPAMGFFPKRRQ